MIVAVTGGRDYAFTETDSTWLETLHAKTPFIEVWDGGATGVDTAVRQWAQRHGIWTVTYWANWRGKGKAAGPLRNVRMLERLRQERKRLGIVIALLAFPGGTGTTHTVTQARNGSIPIYASPGAPWR